MKNFKIVMILVAAVAFFCSCGEKTVTVTMTEQNNVVTYDLASANTLPLAKFAEIAAKEAASCMAGASLYGQHNYNQADCGRRK